MLPWMGSGMAATKKTLNFEPVGFCGSSFGDGRNMITVSKLGTSSLLMVMQKTREIGTCAETGG